METQMQPESEPQHRPPESRRLSRIAAGMLIVFLAVIVLAGLAWAARDRIGLARLFLTPTPEWIHYANPALHISLDYPADWVYREEGGDTILFATSEAALNTEDNPGSGAVLGFTVSTIDRLVAPPGTDLTSPASILDGFVNESAFGETQVGEAVRTYRLGAYPAASTLLLVGAWEDRRTAVYLTAVVQAPDVVLATGFCPEEDLVHFLPIFDRILSTLVIGG